MFKIGQLPVFIVFSLIINLFNNAILSVANNQSSPFHIAKYMKKVYFLLVKIKCNINWFCLTRWLLLYMLFFNQWWMKSNWCRFFCKTSFRVLTFFFNLNLNKVLFSIDVSIFLFGSRIFYFYIFLIERNGVENIIAWNNKNLFLLRF